ncbi:MAG: VWA domain-containing protein [bacterium]|nr:VWA domain-containing protein [bacterium]
MTFLTPDYLIFWMLAAAVLLFLSVALLFKIFFRPPRSKHSHYKLFGKDLVWLPCFVLCLLIAAALAGPEGKFSYVVAAGGQIDVIFAVDNSFSTRANDLKPSRLELAKKEIFMFLNSGVLQKGDRFTLFTFAKNSNWKMPFSEDIDELSSKVAEIDHPDLYIDESQLSTDLNAVLEHIPTAMDKADNFYRSNRKLGLQGPSRRRIVFLFTDGDDQVNNNLDKGLTKLREREIKVYPVGVGTKSGRTIRVKVFNPPNYYYDDESGSQSGFLPGFEEEITVRTVLQTKNLTKIAGFTGGSMFIFDSEQSYLRNFMENAINANRATSMGLSYSTKSKNIWWEILAIPTLVLLFLVVLLI